MCDAAPIRMGYVSRHRRRDLSKYETLYEDPEFERLAAARPRTREDKVTAGTLVGGSTLETMGGLAAVILAVLGFQRSPIELCAVATIAVGVALLSQGGSLVARWSHALRKSKGTRVTRSELVEGVGTEVFGGIVGIALGILALASLRPAVLLPIAAIVLGVALLLGGTMQPDLVYLAPERDPRYARATYSAIRASGSLMVLVGVASAVLGLLGLVQVGPPISLALVAMLCIGFALVIAGSSLTARFVRPLA